MTNQEIFEMADALKAAKEHKKELDRFSRNGSTFYLNTRLFVPPAAGRKCSFVLR
jgi:hypothetical protein